MTIDPKKQYASPYLAMGNNPILRIDPDGGSDTDIYIIDEKGGVEVLKTDHDYDIFLFRNSDGLLERIGDFFCKQPNGFIEMPRSMPGYQQVQALSKNYLDPRSAAAFFGATREINRRLGLTVFINQFNTNDGKHSNVALKVIGKDENQFLYGCIDIQYIGGHVGTATIDMENSQAVIDIFSEYGWFGAYKILTENVDFNGPAFSGTNWVSGVNAETNVRYMEHRSHFHLQFVNPSIFTFKVLGK